MQKLYVLVAVCLQFFLIHCTTAKKNAAEISINNQQVAGRSFHKLFVEVQTVDIQIRKTLETDLVDALMAKGYDGIKSLDAIPFSLKELKLPSEEQIKLQAKETNCDGILLITLTRHDDKLEYNRGTDQKQNDQLGASILSTALNKSGDIKPIASVNTPGSFSYTPSGLVLKSQLYDLPAAGLLFTGQLERIDISAPEKTSKAYAVALIEQLRINKLLK
jgi:hypothetical protein